MIAFITWHHHPWFDICNSDASSPCKGRKTRHRRGKSETLRAQYINTKDVRSGGNLLWSIAFELLNLMISMKCILNLVILQGNYWLLECCWKTSMWGSWDGWLAMYGRPSWYLHYWVSSFWSFPCFIISIESLCFLYQSHSKYLSMVYCTFACFVLWWHLCALFYFWLLTIMVLTNLHMIRNGVINSFL